MKRLALAVAVTLVALGVWYVRSRSDGVPASTTSPAATFSDPRKASPPTTVRRDAPPSHVVQLTPDERRRVADRIASAHAARAHSPVPRPELAKPETMNADDLDHVSEHVLKALEEAIPYLAACYKQVTPDQARPQMRATAMMTLTGDPDIGTVIDADQIFDDKHRPLDPKLDDCLRSTMQTLQLPPLAEGDSVKIQYSFAFDDK